MKCLTTGLLCIRFIPGSYGEWKWKNWVILYFISGVTLLAAGIGLSIFAGLIMILEGVVPVTLLGSALVLWGIGALATVFGVLVAAMIVKNENRARGPGKVTSEVSGDES